LLDSFPVLPPSMRVFFLSCWSVYLFSSLSDGDPAFGITIVLILFHSSFLLELLVLYHFSPRLLPLKRFREPSVWYTPPPQPPPRTNESSYFFPFFFSLFFFHIFPCLNRPKALYIGPLHGVPGGIHGGSKVLLFPFWAGFSFLRSPFLTFLSYQIVPR